MITDANFEKLGKIIQEAVQETKRKVVIICSTDFTHYGYNYGYMPFETDVKENMKKLDTDAIKFITQPDPKGFLNYTEKTGATICGKHALAVLLWLMKEKKGTLLKYYTSGDIAGDYSNAVGYGAVVFS